MLSWCCLMACSSPAEGGTSNNKNKRNQEEIEPPPRGQICGSLFALVLLRMMSHQLLHNAYIIAYYYKSRGHVCYGCVQKAEEGRGKGTQIRARVKSHRGKESQQQDKIINLSAAVSHHGGTASSISIISRREQGERRVGVVVGCKELWLAFFRYSLAWNVCVCRDDHAFCKIGQGTIWAKENVGGQFAWLFFTVADFIFFVSASSHLLCHHHIIVTSSVICLPRYFCFSRSLFLIFLYEFLTSLTQFPCRSSSFLLLLHPRAKTYCSALSCLEALGFSNFTSL